MNLMQNKAFRSLSLSSLFEVIGISFFNMVLLLLAKSTSTPSFWVAAVSIATVLPGVASAFLGKISGSVHHKTRWIITLTLCQSSLFFVLAVLFHGNHDYIAFALIINIVSDMAGIVINLMKMPIIQNKVDEDSQQQAMGIYQSISQLIQPIGQAIGVSYIGLTHDYMTGSLLNGITFLISAIILSVSHQHLDYQQQQADSEPEQETKTIKFKEALQLYARIIQLPVFNSISAIILINALGASIDGILNLYVLDTPSASPFNFGITILIINVLFVFASIAGAVIVNDPFKSLSFKSIITIVGVTIFALYLTLIFNLGLIFTLILLALIAYLAGKINPKMYALLMKNADSSSLSIILGILSSILTMATPFGTIILVGGYPIFGKNIILCISSVMAIIAAIIIQIGKAPKEQTNSSHYLK